MSRSGFAIVVVGAILISSATTSRQVIASGSPTAPTTLGQFQVSPHPVCTGKYKGGATPSASELAAILKRHKEWVQRRYIFLNALKAWRINAARLPYGWMQDEGRANLCDANLGYVDLSGANLFGADLNNTFLKNAHLAGAILILANLRGANLTGADLTGANLSETDLTGADFGLADLASADFDNADMADTFLDCNPDSLPRVVPGLDSVENLQLVTFHDEPASLVKLRSAFKDLGMRTQEAQLTYAIRRSEINRKHYPNGPYLHTRVERLINLVLFDWTCQYGMSPGRPVVILACFAAIFALIYIPAQSSLSRGGIWAVWEEHRIDKNEGSDEPQRLRGFPSTRPRGRISQSLSIVLLASYFSLLSALRIGWSGLNFGTWISRMQLSEYSLHATGWPRFASGVQSLISVYLVALAILTYFGSPFEY